MRNVKTDNNDLIQYLKTVEELKNHISIEEYKKEYSSLVCAQSMAKQLADPHKHTISISHLLIANLKIREEPEKMLQELEKVK